MKLPSQDKEKSFHLFATLLAISSLAHLSIHLPHISFSAEWISGALVLLAAGWCLGRPQVKPLLALAALQCVSVVLVAPYNPDHWLLLFFINLIILVSALRLRLSEGEILPQRLMQQITPSARLVFLVCYGFAALAKYNSDFLFSPNGAAQELFRLQVGAMPILKWLVWAPMVPWISIFCESAIPLLLLHKRTRAIGVLIGVGFHTALILSPAVKVYDFTLMIITMLYLFTPDTFDAKIKASICRLQDLMPGVFELVEQTKWQLAFAPTIAVLVISCWYPLLELPPRMSRLQGAVGLLVAIAIGLVLAKGLTGGLGQQSTVRWAPRSIFGWLVIAVALLNGFCPYLGLKTQGSFTMFSSLRTEAGKWNHLILPRTMQVVSSYQDKLVKVVESNSDPINHAYVDRDLLATEFEIHRTVATNPEISITLEKDGQQICINGGESMNSILGPPPSMLLRKLMVFRPVSPDGRNFLTN